MGKGLNIFLHLFIFFVYLIIRLMYNNSCFGGCSILSFTLLVDYELEDLQDQ